MANTYTNPVIRLDRRQRDTFAEPPTEEPGCPDCGAHVASEGEHCPTCDPTGSAAWDRALDASEALGD